MDGQFQRGYNTKVVDRGTFSADPEQITTLGTYVVGKGKIMSEPQSLAPEPSELKERKKQIREQAHANRSAQKNKEELSAKIVETFEGLEEYKRAGTVMYYVDVRSEVRTRQALPTALTNGKKIVVPYCVDGELELFHLENMEELAVGMYKILEPREDLRKVAAKKVAVEELDLVMVPGVAFDRIGARMGHGMGYYDKLLEHARKDTPLIALAFECQLFPEIPTQAHDIFMDKIITESTIYPGKGR